MGLFGINMPLLYGEGGEHAFIRLQEEILKASTDESIFAWDATVRLKELACWPHTLPISQWCLNHTAPHTEKSRSSEERWHHYERKLSENISAGPMERCSGLHDRGCHKRISLQVLKGADCSRTPMPFSMTSRSSEIAQVFFMKRRREIHSTPEHHICEISRNSDSFVLQEAWPGTCWSKVGHSAEHHNVRTQTQREGQDAQSLYRLNVRRAWRLALDSGMTNSQRLVAALALSCRDRPDEAFVLGIMFTLPEVKYALTLKKLRGNIYPISTSEFRNSGHWADISGLIEARANKKVSFDGSHSPYIDTPGRRVTT